VENIKALVLREDTKAQSKIIGQAGKTASAMV
jgi:hypothetical protein